jgi:hypothetical protein
MSKNNKEGNETITFSIRLWKKDLDKVIYKGKEALSFWEDGTVTIDPNSKYNIQSMEAKPHYCLDDIPGVIREICREQKIIIASTCRRPRLFSSKRGV